MHIDVSMPWACSLRMHCFCLIGKVCWWSAGFCLVQTIMLWLASEGNVLKFGDVLPNSNRNVFRNVILQSWPSKIKVICQNKWYHRIPRSRHQNGHPKCFSSNVMVKDVNFAKNVVKRKALEYDSHSNSSRFYLHFIQRPWPKLPSVAFWWPFSQHEPSYGLKYDFKELWAWKVKVICEDQSYFALQFAPYSTVRTHVSWEVSLRS